MSTGADAAPERTDTVIIGAGPSGLAVAACLRRAAVPFIALERADGVAPTWRTHYDRLHLHTIKQCSSLPYLRFAKETPRYPPRRDVVRYLESYADRFGIVPRLGREVSSARRDGEGWEVRARARETDREETYRSARLVVATGYNGVPNVPTWPGQDAFEGEVRHSFGYRNGSDLAGKRVLVVGIGNTGGEIALDLFEHGARPTIAVRSPTHVLARDSGGVPAQIFGIFLRRLPLRAADAIGGVFSRLLYGDLPKYGIERPAMGAATQVATTGRIPLIDIGTVARIRRGEIDVAPGIERFTPRGVVHEGGEARSYDAVILATGYRPRLERFLERAHEVTDARGYPRWHGEEVKAPGMGGLYFLGYSNPISGALREIRLEALAIARAITKSRGTA